MWKSEVEHLFPLGGMTNLADKRWLTMLYEHVRSIGCYRYIEIGSFIGGSLTPALLDEKCLLVTSIDARQQLTQDSTNALIEYRSTTAQMLEVLQRVPGADLRKLVTLDGQAKDCILAERYDMALIDGEHTDQAAFRDFLAIYPHLSECGICIFHDSNQVSTAIDNALSLLESQNQTFAFGAFEGSLLSAIFLGRDAVPPGFLTVDWEEYKTRNRDQVLFAAMQNRCQFEVTLKLKDEIPVDVRSR